MASIRALVTVPVELPSASAKFANISPFYSLVRCDVTTLAFIDAAPLLGGYASDQSEPNLMRY